MQKEEGHQEDKEHLEEVEAKEQDEQCKETREEKEVLGEQQLWDYRDQERNHEVKLGSPVMEEEKLQQVKQEKEEEYDVVEGEKSLNS